LTTTRENRTSGSDVAGRLSEDDDTKHDFKFRYREDGKGHFLDKSFLKVFFCFVPFLGMISGGKLRRERGLLWEREEKRWRG
jgi:hypothetical protein